LNSILKDGRVVRGWLGISLTPNTGDEDVLTTKPVGITVADVLRDGPADVAGVKRGDKIIQVNDQQISSASHLINYVAMQAPESSISLIVEREGKRQTLQVKVGERKVQQNAQSQFIPLPKE
jgi:serine protease DegS/serine protease DegQ